MRHRLHWHIYLFIILGLSTQAYAAAVVIEDRRLLELDASPQLGRGFSNSTNRYYSTCFDEFEVKGPVVKLSHNFSNISGIDDLSSWFKSDRGLDSEMLSFVREQIKGELQRMEDITSQNGSGLRAPKRHIHFVLGHLIKDSYFSPLDEAVLKFESGTLKRLREGEFTDFFTTCGTSYIRALTRQTRLITFISYESESEKPDPTIVVQLEGYSRCEISNQGDSDDSGECSLTFASKSIPKEIRARKINAVVRGWGLDSNSIDASPKMSRHISESERTYDFTNALSDLYQQVRKSSSGRVSSMEVIPWTESSIFQTHTNAMLEGGMDSQVVSIPLSEKRDNLYVNAEFITKLGHQIRGTLDYYYRGSVCLDATRFLALIFPGSALINHIRLEPGIRVEALLKKLHEDSLDRLFQRYQADFNGLGLCLEALEEYPTSNSRSNFSDDRQTDRSTLNGQTIGKIGIWRNRWNSETICQDLLKSMGTRERDKLIGYIEAYCLPQKI